MQNCLQNKVIKKRNRNESKFCCRRGEGEIFAKRKVVEVKKSKKVSSFEKEKMCAAQSNPAQSFGGYTWGFADNTRAESVLEISPNINYTVSSESVSKEINM